ncbi:MAG: hypothetical protein KF875_00915 [Trueperaceae bacterium]|nr:hypothetical protein [Trueperaceae bacterium]MCW5819511.1 hypothetical protein [Trueperaceae bacterium]
MKHENSKTMLAALYLVVPLLWLLVSCGGSPGPKPPSGGGTLTVKGSVALPTGHGLDLTKLTVSTPIGTYPVSATGEFTATVFGGAMTELGVEAADGSLLLLGTTNGTDATVSLASTAEALLYYLVGGMWLPPAQQDTVRSLLRGVPEGADLAAELERQLLAGGNGVAAPDAGLLAALEAAHASLLGASRLDPSALGGATLDGASLVPGASGRQPGQGLAGASAFSQAGVSVTVTPAAVDGSNIIIEPTTRQTGVFVLHNPAGAGVVAQNHFRRPAALLAYEEAWEDADRVEHPVDPPMLVERVEVPATGQLEFLNALLDVVTGNSPWSPVTSPALKLAGHEGASRTHYRLILVGPSATDATWPIMGDPLFMGFHDQWSDIAIDKSVELFLDDLLIPLMEVYGLGNMAKLDAAKLNKMRERVKVIYDTHLMGLGVFLKPGSASYANGLKFVIQELVENRNFRLDMMNMVAEALEESDKNKAAIDAMEKRLSARASASAIAAAVQTVLVSGDVAKIMYDLVGSPSVVDWTAVSAPALFALTPDQATVTRSNASARFTVVPKGQTSGNYLYRWTTSGTYGELSDLLRDGRTLDTREAEVWYFHDSPLNIKDTDYDTVKVEVFEVEAGATTVPAGASPIARMASSVRGDDRVLDSRLEVNYGATPTGMFKDGMRFGCAEMLLRFKAEKGAKSYLVSLRGVGGQGDERNANQDFRFRGPNQTVFIDPNAKYGTIVEDGYTSDYYGTCDWRAPADPSRFAGQPITTSAHYDRAKDEYIVYLFVNADYSGIVLRPVSLPERVALWYGWVENATFEVKVNR